jgi:hypothetical protein
MGDLFPGPDIVREVLRSEGSKLLATASGPPPLSLVNMNVGMFCDDSGQSNKHALRDSVLSKSFLSRCKLLSGSGVACDAALKRD